MYICVDSRSYIFQYMYCTCTCTYMYERCMYENAMKFPNLHWIYNYKTAVFNCISMYSVLVEVELNCKGTIVCTCTCMYMHVQWYFTHYCIYMYVHACTMVLYLLALGMYIHVYSRPSHTLTDVCLWWSRRGMWSWWDVWGPTSEKPRDWGRQQRKTWKKPKYVK